MIQIQRVKRSYLINGERYIASRSYLWRKARQGEQDANGRLLSANHFVIVHPRWCLIPGDPESAKRIVRLFYIDERGGYTLPERGGIFYWYFVIGGRVYARSDRKTKSE